MSASSSATASEQREMFAAAMDRLTAAKGDEGKRKVTSRDLTNDKRLFLAFVGHKPVNAVTREDASK